MYYIKSLIAFIPYFIDVAIYWAWLALIWVIITLIGLIWYNYYNKMCIRQFVATEIIFIYVFYIIVFTVLSRTVMQDYQYELIPFWSYIKAFKGERVYGKQIVYNILMFVPLGVMVPMLNQKVRVKSTVIVGVCFSLIIEVLQLVLKRGMFEFDDIISNSLGAAFGSGIYYLVKMYLKCKMNGTKGQELKL